MKYLRYTNILWNILAASANCEEDIFPTTVFSKNGLVYRGVMTRYVTYASSTSTSITNNNNLLITLLAEIVNINFYTMIDMLFARHLCFTCYNNIRIIDVSTVCIENNRCYHRWLLSIQLSKTIVKKNYSMIVTYLFFNLALEIFS